MAKERKKRDATPIDETKSEKFSRLASKRTVKAVKAISNIGNLFSRSYEFTPSQVTQIGAYLKDAWDKAFAKSQSPGAGKSDVDIKI